MSNVGKQFHPKNDGRKPKAVYTVLWEDAKGVLVEYAALYNNAPSVVRYHYTTEQFNVNWVAIPINEYTILYRPDGSYGWSVWQTLSSMSEFAAAEELKKARATNSKYNQFKLVKTV